MDTKEITSLRDECATAITNLLRAYESTTGCRVEQAIILRSYESENHNNVTGVKLQVVLP